MFILKAKSILIYLLISIFAIFILLMGFNKDEYKSVTADKADYVDLPVLMYHGICEKDKEQSKFVISKNEFLKDIKFLKKSGYTPIGTKELIDYVNGSNDNLKSIKPVLITFDDGYYNNYLYAYPILKEYDAKAVISIIGKYTDLYSKGETESPIYSHITWEEAKEMISSNLVEIQNHSYDSHTIDEKRNGTKINNNETKEAYKEYMQSDLGKLQEEISQNLGYTPCLFAYPFGSVCEASFDVLKEMGFRITLSCEEKLNKVVKGDEKSLYMLGRYLRSNEVCAADIIKEIEKDNK